MQVEPWMVAHMDQWLDRNVDGDTCRAEVRAAMLEVLASDVEWFSCQSWWQTFDAAKGDRIRAKYR